MSSDIKQSIQVSLNNAFVDYINKIDKLAFTNELGNLIEQLIIKRTQEGFDVKSRKFGNYNAGYNKVKAQKGAAKRSGMTSYASTSKSKKLQLTGSLFSSITTRPKKFVVNKRGIHIVLECFINDSLNQLKAEGLQSTTGRSRSGSYSKKSWEFFGLAHSGNYVNSESKAIQDFVFKSLGKISGGRVSVGTN